MITIGNAMCYIREQAEAAGNKQKKNKMKMIEMME